MHRLISLSPIESSDFIVKAATVRITFRVLRRSIDDLITCDPFPKADLQVSDFMAQLENLIRQLKGENALVGISVMSNDYLLFRKVSALFRDRAPDVPLIAGGPHFVHHYRVKGQADEHFPQS